MQTPSLNPDEDLDLELGETIYEDKWVWEWTLLLKLLMLTVPIAIFLAGVQWYDNNTGTSVEYNSRFNFNVIAFNTALNSMESDKVERLNYWGKELWVYQHWIRKFILYPLLMLYLYCFVLIVRSIGSGSVCKAAFNRSKDLVFIWTPGEFGIKRLHIAELHYLERTKTHIPSAWKHYAELNGNKKGGYVQIDDLRTNQLYNFKTNDIYWNHDLKSYFDSNTSTYWKGHTCKDINRGIFINNSAYSNIEEAERNRLIDEEIKDSIKKYGPIQKVDYEYSFKYQIKKRLNDSRFKLLSGVSHAH